MDGSPKPISPMKELKIFWLASKSVDPWWNLALEAHLLDVVGSDQVFFYIWQNEHTVVVGRNQNPWKECCIQLLEKDKGKLARRLSGGGAVYHDLGNLNFTFIMSKALYDLDRQFSMLTDAVQDVGISVSRNGRNDIVVKDGRKFSGNAFYLRPAAALHHGTILIDANIEKVQLYLNVPRDKLVSKGVDSVRSRVTNLRELNPSLTVAQMSTALLRAFNRTYGQIARPLGDLIEIDNPRVQNLREKFASEDWRFGVTPDFNFRCGRRFAWGEVEFCLNVQKGRIQSATVFSDALEPDLIDALGPCLKGAAFVETAVIERLQALAGQIPHQIIFDIIDYFQTHPLSG